MDYPELIAELVDRTGESAVPLRAKLFLTMAEAAINKSLRFAENLVDDTLTTDSIGEIELPDDYLAMKSLLSGQWALEQVDVDTLPCRTYAYAVHGGKIVTRLSDSDLTIRYYAALPPLDDTGTNWLIESDPEIYLYAMMQQVFMFKLDAEKARAARAVFDELIGAKKQSDMMARLAKKPYRVLGGVV